MISQEVAKKYAGALFMSVRERGLVDDVYQQFQGLREVVAANPKLMGLLSGPMLSVNEKLGLVDRLFGGQMNRLAVEFLGVLIRKRRISFLKEVIDELEYRIEQEKGIARATVITALPCSSDDESQLVKQLEVKTGLKIVLTKKVDPSIIGGAIVMLRDEIVDGSVRHGLAQLHDRLAKLRVH